MEIRINRDGTEFGPYTLEQVNHALRTHLRPDDLELTVVCTAADIRSEIAQIHRIQTLETIDYMEP